MTGLSQQAQLAMLADTTTGVKRNLWLRLFTGATAGLEPDEDGVLTDVAELTGAGYAPIAIVDTQWSDGAAGPPSTIQLPKSGGSPISFTASGGNFTGVVAWALTTASGTYSASTMFACGPIVDAGGTPQRLTVTDGSSITFDDANPIIIRMGDPEPGTVPM